MTGFLVYRTISRPAQPQEVEEEIVINDKPGLNALKEAIGSGIIEVVNQKKVIHLGLDKGETAAISLARERNDTILLDDAAAIKAAEALNITTMRTTSILFVAVQKKILTKKEALVLLNKIIENGYYIAPRYYMLLTQKLNS